MKSMQEMAAIKQRDQEEGRFYNAQTESVEETGGMDPFAIIAMWQEVKGEYEEEGISFKEFIQMQGF